MYAIIACGILGTALGAESSEKKPADYVVYYFDLQRLENVQAYDGKVEVNADGEVRYELGNNKKDFRIRPETARRLLTRLVEVGIFNLPNRGSVAYSGPPKAGIDAKVGNRHVSFLVGRNEKIPEAIHKEFVTFLQTIDKKYWKEK